MDNRIFLGLLCFLLIPSLEGIKYRKENAGLQTFPDIPDLATEVRLSSNQITSIPANALSTAPKTWVLVLQRNQITNTSENAFNGTRIGKLYLDYNPLTYVPYFPNIDDTLFELTMIGCKVTNETWDLVVRYSKLSTLVLESNAINHMPDLNATKSTLLNLNLKGCQIRDIQPHYFEGFQALKSLDLQRNKLVELKDYAFAGLNTLSTLLFQNNPLVRTNRFTYFGLTSLKFYVSASGHLTTFPCIGPYSPNLWKFDVSSNRIEDFPTDCAKLSKVTEFTFSSNNLQDGNINAALSTFTNVRNFNLENVGKLCLELDALNKLKQSTHIDLGENNLGFIIAKNCSTNKTEQDERSLDLPGLSKLELHRNNLEQIPNISLLVNLKDFYLSNNKLTVLPSHVFAGNKNLKTLIIQGNLLTEVPDFSVIGKSLTTVDLSFNRLSAVNADAFKNLTVLRTINLERNQIVTFDVSNLQHTPSLYHVNLKYNSLTSTGDPYKWCTGTTCTNFRIEMETNKNIPCDESRCWAKRYPAPPITSTFVGCFDKSWASVTMEDLKCPDVRNMEVERRIGARVIFRNSVPASNDLPKSIRSMPSYQMCALWCSDIPNCVFFEHEPKTRIAPDGICTIRFN